MTDSVFVVENADLGASVVGVDVDLAMNDGVLVVETAALGASVVAFSVDLAFTDDVFALDDSIFLVPLTTAEYEAFG